MFIYFYLVVFIIAIIFFSKFQFGHEGKDERGQIILNRSYTIIFPMFIIGWIIIRLIEDFVMPLDGDDWRMAMWYLITGIMILHSFLIYVFRRIY
ncbi:hypothetical protein [Saliterribacillus persicus]|uniref:Uncharacterized protein n=1 Tax=Saliterribacillus persicus TaxID=930114 RepID=A0A368YBD5_9BACI|nr:hypothetical protein [Saliterribacillus persicus]RCW77512.1 hypothetical protein DFR57_101387 [Saliterribacillus persicus]